MIFHKQRHRHRPEEGIFGDCQRTCYAMILDKQPEDIPNFGVHIGNSEAWGKAIKDFLASQGLAASHTVFGGESLDTVLITQKCTNPGQLYLLAGQSRNGVNHVVVCCDDKIIADPALDDSGIIGPCDDGYYWVERLVPLYFMYEHKAADSAGV
jgi:hypothetical protein